MDRAAHRNGCAVDSPRSRVTTLPQSPQPPCLTRGCWAAGPTPAHLSGCCIRHRLLQDIPSPSEREIAFFLDLQRCDYITSSPQRAVTPRIAKARRMKHENRRLVFAPPFQPTVSSTVGGLLDYLTPTCKLPQLPLLSRRQMRGSGRMVCAWRQEQNAVYTQARVRS